MTDYASQLADLRQELDALKAALQRAIDPDEQLQIQACINAGLHSYLQLVNANLQAALAAAHPRLVA
jgi:hypothetical protein